MNRALGASLGAKARVRAVFVRGSTADVDKLRDTRLLCCRDQSDHTAVIDALESLSFGKIFDWISFELDRIYDCAGACERCSLKG